MGACDSLRRSSAWVLAFAALALTACSQVGAEGSGGHGANGDSGVLWRLVRDGCVPAARRQAYPPKPCVEVSAPPGEFERGYAVLKDIRGRYQYLVLPVVRITGIESAAVVTPDAPNYFADAWVARLYVEAALHKTVPRDDLSLAVNSEYGRTQNQLHIHVDCVRPDVHDVLRKLLPTLTTRWTTLPVRLQGHVYRAEWVAGASLTINPFRALADGLPAGAPMGSYGLAVIGARSATGQPGFILLATRAGTTDNNDGSAEELQDHNCAVTPKP